VCSTALPRTSSLRLPLLTPGRALTSAVAIFNGSNRQKATGVKHTPEILPKVDALIAAAIARFQGEDKHADLDNELDEDYRRAFAEW